MSLELPLKENFVSFCGVKKTELFHLKNANGLQCAVTNYGARVVSLLVPDIEGNLTDVVVGFANITDYLKADCPYYGAIIGRFANRIAAGNFILDGQQYQLEINNGPNALHGGSNGFHNQVWDAKQLSDRTVELKHLSPDGEEGYPGELRIKVLYTLTDENELKIDYEVTSDKKTIVNVTNHNFWNLNGEGAGSILNHNLKLTAQKITGINADSIPIGLLDVANTAFDFNDLHTIGERIERDEEQLKNGVGYDHNFVLDKGLTKIPASIGFVRADASGIVMEVLTTEPGVQFYTGNFMQGKDSFKHGAKDNYRTAFCLETQHFPDSPNQSDFPTTVLEAGSIYRSTTIYKFSTSEI